MRLIPLITHLALGLKRLGSFFYWSNMSRSKPRLQDEIHQLKRENEQLKTDIRKLERKLANQEKVEKLEKKYSKKIKIEEIRIPDPSICPICLIGKITMTELGNKKFIACSLVCGYHKVIK